MKLRSLRILAAFTFCLSFGPSIPTFALVTDPPLFFIPQPMPTSHVMNAIKGAKSSIHMLMYNLTQPAVIDELIAAHLRGVDVQVILDQQNVGREKPTGAYHRLSEAKVRVVKSSPGFSLSHAKSFVIDRHTAYITTINLTRIADVTRGAGYITTDAKTVRFVLELFALDLKNAETQGLESPKHIPDNIVLSPVNSRSRLQNMILGARRSVHVVVENMSDTVIINELIAAKKRGVQVQVLFPRCNLGTADFDLPAAQTLRQGGVHVRMMPDPSNAEVPYIHQKTMVIDGQTAYLGSINFTFNSLDKARELGLIFSDRVQVQQLTAQFNTDFPKGWEMPEAEVYKCPVRTFNSEVLELE